MIINADLFRSLSVVNGEWIAANYVKTFSVLKYGSAEIYFRLVRVRLPEINFRATGETRDFYF